MFSDPGSSMTSDSGRGLSEDDDNVSRANLNNTISASRMGKNQGFPSGFSIGIFHGVFKNQHRLMQQWHTELTRRRDLFVSVKDEERKSGSHLNIWGRYPN